MGDPDSRKRDRAGEPGRPEFIGMAVGLPLVPTGPACGPGGCDDPEPDDPEADGRAAHDASVESGAQFEEDKWLA